MGPALRQTLKFNQEVSGGWCILVPAGTWHNLTNIGNEPMQLYAIYALPNQRGVRAAYSSRVSPKRVARASPQE